MNIATSGDNLATLEPSDWTPSFESHPLREREGDPRPCYPVALYLDGVKFTRSIGPGRSDSLVAFTTYNLATERRHLLACLSKRETCKCGCGGWCTV
eukprot:2985841-Pyramimonas_sp.AAC.1